MNNIPKQYRHPILTGRTCHKLEGMDRRYHIQYGPDQMNVYERELLALGFEAIGEQEKETDRIDAVCKEIDDDEINRAGTGLTNEKLRTFIERHLPQGSSSVRATDESVVNELIHVPTSYVSIDEDKVHISEEILSEFGYYKGLPTVGTSREVDEAINILKSKGKDLEGKYRYSGAIDVLEREMPTAQPKAVNDRLVAEAEENRLFLLKCEKTLQECKKIKEDVCGKGCNDSDVVKNTCKTCNGTGVVYNVGSLDNEDEYSNCIDCLPKVESIYEPLINNKTVDDLGIVIALIFGFGKEQVVKLGRILSKWQSDLPHTTLSTPLKPNT